MALIVENGSGVPNATSFISVQFVRDYATARGRTIPPEGSGGDAEIEQKATIAADFIVAMAGKFKGRRVFAVSLLPFPRAGIVVDNVVFGSDEIPLAVQYAQAELTLAALDGVDLMPTLDGAEVKREKIGPLETEYVTGSSRGSAPIVARAFAMLQPFFATISLKVARA